MIKINKLARVFASWNVGKTPLILHGSVLNMGLWKAHCWRTEWQAVYKKSETKRTKGKAKGKRRLAHEQLHTLQFTLSNLEATTTISNRNIKDLPKKHLQTLKQRTKYCWTCQACWKVPCIVVVGLTNTWQQSQSTCLKHLLAGTNAGFPLEKALLADTWCTVFLTMKRYW